MIKNKIIGATMATAGTALFVANLNYAFKEGCAHGTNIQRAKTPKEKVKAYAWYGVAATRNVFATAGCGLLIGVGETLMKM